MSVLCVPPRVRVVVLRAPPLSKKIGSSCCCSRGAGGMGLPLFLLPLCSSCMGCCCSRAPTRPCLPPRNWSALCLLPSLFLSSGAWEVLEALCLSFVCHLVCELLFFEPLPSRKKLGQVVVVLAGPGGWVYHSFSLLFAPHALAVVSIIVVVVRCVRSGGGSMSVLCVPPPVRVVVVRPPPRKKIGSGCCCSRGAGNFFGY